MLITTRLLPHFSAKNVDAMKSCIFHQFGCTNEVEFLCKVLEKMGRSLSNEAISIIQNKAVEIAEAQPVKTQSVTPHTSKNY